MPLITTLEKIAATSGQSADKPNWHHFSIRQRIDYLRKCEADSFWISHHNRKVNKSIGVYVTCLITLGVLGYQLNVGDMGDRINRHFLEKVLVREIEQTPDNPNLFSLLGNIYYNDKNWAGVQDAWERSLALNPDDAQVLNNLAWHYATCEDPQYKNPERALSLAQLAIQLERQSHVWDTLAESYYVNGRYGEAVNAGEQALALAVNKLEYYREQLDKFKKAAGE
jgi:tetratricopeptide (TPR) repeat protein